MKVNISLKHAIQSAIFFFMAVAVVLVWPLKLIRPWQYVGEIDPDSKTIVDKEGNIMQEFTPQMYGLSFISFYIYNEEMLEIENGTMIFRLFDENMQQITEKRFSLDTLSIPGICRIRTGDMQIGARYYFSLESENAELLLSMSDGINLDVRYDYKTLFTRGQYAIYAVAVFAVGALLMLLAEFMLRKDTHQVRLDFGFRFALSILATGVSFWGMWNVFPGKKFSMSLPDIVFYEIGIVLFLTFALYGLLHKRDTPTDMRISREDVISRIPDILQSVAFAGVMLGGVKYLNATSIYHQKLGSNIALSCFAAAIICSYSKKEIINWYNLVYLFPAIGCGIYYIQQNKEDIEHWDIYKGNALCYILWGIVLLNTIRMVTRDKINKVSKVYFLALVLLVAELVRSRNNRIWPIDIALFWGFFAVRIVYKGKVRKYLHNFTNGIFLHFIGISFYAMLFRPFHNFVYVRYPGVFHTVTFTAVYLALVLVLALIRFLEVYRSSSLKRAWKEIWLIGMAGAFLLMTISRVGYMAAVILCTVILIMTSVVEFKDGIRGFMKRTGILVCTTVCFFPILFTVCRIVPAVVSRPVTYEIEWFHDSIIAGEEWDSPKFITLSRFFGIADERLIYNGSQEGAGATGTTGTTASNTVTENNNDYSNGRLDIFRLYIKQLNWKGHETVSIKDEKGQETGHAHNVFIQVAHDFGIGAGIYFIVFCIFAGIRSIYYYLHHEEEDTGLVPLGILGVFGVCGLVEWVFIPYIPTGFAFLLVLVLLIPTENKEPEKNEKNSKHSIAI